MRKILGILLAVIFLVSLSATAVSAACDNCNWLTGCKDKCDCDCNCKDKCDKKCDWWGCNDKCDCDCKDKCDCDCKDKCDCKKKPTWIGDFWNWGVFGKKFWF